MPTIRILLGVVSSLLPICGAAHSLELECDGARRSAQIDGKDSDICRGIPRGDAGIVAITRQRLHPVLIRNEHNPLIQVVITGNDEIESRILSYELAYRMQVTAPELVDLLTETAATRKMYGLDNKKTEWFGSN